MQYKCRINADSVQIFGPNPAEHRSTGRAVESVVHYNDKKENRIYLVYKGIQSGAVAMS